MNELLADLNFKSIVDYGGQPIAKSRYATPQPCFGYCTSCEDSGLLEQTGGRLDLMSHGCDSSDYESVLGPMPSSGIECHDPILFLLENPGGDYGNGAPVEWRGHKKQPPVNHYYWLPHNDKWPDEPKDFCGNFYGPYFAYLMKKHGLKNVYITNVIKCKWVPEQGKRDEGALRNHCINRYLKREVEIFLPKIAFCFGNSAFGWSAEALHGRCERVLLYHPQYIEARHRVHGRTQKEVFDENDMRIIKGIDLFMKKCSQ